MWDLKRFLIYSILGRASTYETTCTSRVTAGEMVVSIIVLKAKMA